MTDPRRFLVLATLLGVLVVGGLVDRVGHPPPAGAAPPSAASGQMPSTPPPSALSSSWYCTGGTAASGGQANGDVLVTNLGSTELSGSLTAVPSSGASVRRPLSVPARTTVAVAATSLVQAPYVSEEVVLGGGSAIVSQTVGGPLGTSASPCASTTSSQWYLADGSTLEGDDLVLSLFNPAATDAVADLSFATDQGPSAPGDFQGVVVPAGTMLAVDVRSHVQNRTSVATTVSTRSGRLVVAGLSLQTARPPSGMSLVLAAPSTSLQWVFPRGRTGPGLVDSYHLYNPASATAQVSVAFNLSSGSAQPLRIAIPPMSEQVVTANDQSRVPPQVDYSTSVTVQGGAGIVAERSGVLSSPQSVTGRPSMLGAAVASRSWAISSGGVPGTGSSEALIVANVSGVGATETIESVAGGTRQVLVPPGRVHLEPGQIYAVPVAAAPEAEHPAYLVTSDVPVVVERDLYTAASPGVSVALGSLAL